MASKHVVVRPGAWKVTAKKDKSKVETLVQRELHTTTRWAIDAKDAPRLATNVRFVPAHNAFIIRPAKENEIATCIFDARPLGRHPPPYPLRILP